MTLARLQNHVFVTMTIVIKINIQFIRNSDEDELVLACCIAAGFSSEKFYKFIERKKKNLQKCDILHYLPAVEFNTCTFIDAGIAFDGLHV